MNNVRRKSLSTIADKLERIKESLEELMEEEEEYRDNMPENLQGSERYEKAEDACCNLDNALTGIVDAIDAIQAAIE